MKRKPNKGEDGMFFLSSPLFIYFATANLLSSNLV